ncbi:glutaredoxin family protein [Paeniglutamicibacter terrestris]|uniref:Glutaredoxin family protein n=1 Tax=Paeniglutamicibacter terrestris TaxID=2723403 RepID=A0ABX1G497_9MICC|nr:glutaredoxin family protein [Paeniglutamicibacter terrestris]NKG21066.1 glutaredoxin family protein [Paeniglutamicibacter terrestris]
MSRTITVYTRPIGCGQCMATKFWLDSRKIPYTAISLADVDPALMAQFHAWNYSQAPVVTVHIDGVLVAHWYGFNPDKLEEFTKGTP